MEPKISLWVLKEIRALTFGARRKIIFGKILTLQSKYIVYLIDFGVVWHEYVWMETPRLC